MHFCPSCNRAVGKTGGVCPSCGAKVLSVPDLELGLPEPAKPAAPLPKSGSFSPAAFAPQREVSAEDIEPIRLELMDERLERRISSARLPVDPLGPAPPREPSSPPANRVSSPPVGLVSRPPASVASRPPVALEPAASAARRYAPIAAVIAIVLAGAAVLKLLAKLLDAAGISSPSP